MFQFIQYLTSGSIRECRPFSSRNSFLDICDPSSLFLPLSDCWFSLTVVGSFPWGTPQMGVLFCPFCIPFLLCTSLNDLGYFQFSSPALGACSKLEVQPRCVKAQHSLFLIMDTIALNPLPSNLAIGGSGVCGGKLNYPVKFTHSLPVLMSLSDRQEVKLIFLVMLCLPSSPLPPSPEGGWLYGACVSLFLLMEACAGLLNKLKSSYRYLI